MTVSRWGGKGVDLAPELVAIDKARRGTTSTRVTAAEAAHAAATGCPTMPVAAAAHGLVAGVCPCCGAHHTHRGVGFRGSHYSPGGVYLVAGGTTDRQN